MTQPLIKSKERVQQHGEVFTPTHIVEQMLNVEGVKEACEQLATTFLEPSAGEGAFLVEILRRKLVMVSQCYNDTVAQYAQYSLWALSTLYGVELLEDNANMCRANLFRCYQNAYTEQLVRHNEPMNDKILQSAKTIIRANIVQGNFLTRQTTSNHPIIFSEWRVTTTQPKVKVHRTEYTLESIYDKIEYPNGHIASLQQPMAQLNLFALEEEVMVNECYAETLITDTYLEKKTPQ